MDSIWLWPLALVAFLLTWPAVRALTVRLTRGRFRVPAQATLPARVNLLYAAKPEWRHEQERDAAVRQLLAAGFVNAGSYRVRELPGMTLGMYAHRDENAYAVLNDHPRAGFWADLVTRYEDGRVAVFSTLEPMTANAHEGSAVVSEPHHSLADLWTRMLAERPQGTMMVCDPFRAAPDYEHGYAAAVRWNAEHPVAVPAPEAAIEDSFEESEEMRQAA